MCFFLPQFSYLCLFSNTAYIMTNLVVNLLLLTVICTVTVKGDEDDEGHSNILWSAHGNLRNSPAESISQGATGKRKFKYISLLQMCEIFPVWTENAPPPRYRKSRGIQYIDCYYKLFVT